MGDAVDHLARVVASVRRERAKRECHPNLISRSIWLSSDMAKAVDDLAVAQKRSRSDIIRRAIRAYMKTEGYHGSR